MDGRGRWLDNVFVERLWRSVKYEEIYLKTYENDQDARENLTRYFRFYNEERLHQSLKNETPNNIYFGSKGTKNNAALYVCPDNYLKKKT